MKGAFIIVILISMLIAGWLVAKNMQTDNVEGVDKMESIQKAKDTADVVDKAVENMKKAMEE